jgi:hypothetical protein
MFQIPFIRTARGVSVVLDNKTVSVAADEVEYQAILQAIRDGDQRELLRMLDSKAARLAAAAITTNGAITISDGAVYHRGKPVNDILTQRMLENLEQGFDLNPMCRFIENLMQNPSYRATEELYPFLESGGIPITVDGHFMAYKAVRSDYMDIFSGTFDNSVGSACEMPRNQVNEDSHQTCSNGLHVCSFDYLPNFAHANGHVMLVRVNPRDVVAIPADYHNTKMRVSRYVVEGEVHDYYEEHRDVLREAGVWLLTSDDPDEDYIDEESDEDSNDESCAHCGY